MDESSLLLSFKKEGLAWPAAGRRSRLAAVAAAGGVGERGEKTMVGQGTIQDAIRMVSREMASGSPGPATLAAGAMIGQTGATGALVGYLVAEMGRKRPAARLVQAGCFLLETALSELRMGRDGGGAAEAGRLAAACEAVEAAVAGAGLPTELLMLIARAVVQGGLEPGPALRGAMEAALEADFDPALAEQAEGGMGAHLAKIAVALGHDPFAIHGELVSSGAAVPAAHRAAMAAQLAGSAVPALHDAALGFVLDADAAPGDAVLAVLGERARQHRFPSGTVERLVRMRPWLAAARQPAVDAAIRALRAGAEAVQPAVGGEVTMLLATLCDGAGAQSLFGVVKQGRRHTMAAVLLKQGVGVAEAWINNAMTRRDADGLMARITGTLETVKVKLGFVEQALAAGLAVNLARQVPPPFTLVQVFEVLGLGLVPPVARAPGVLADELLEGVSREQTGPAAARAALLGAAGWPEMFDVVGSWFESGAAVEALLGPIVGRRARVAAVLREVLPGRRLFWAERCAWMAATLKAGAGDDGTEWVGLALVARELASGRELAENPLFALIAEATVDAFAARAPARRAAKPGRGSPRR